MGKLVIIYYHDIVEAGKGYSYQRVEVEQFEQQMKYLKEEGYVSLLFEDLGQALPEKSVLITFDDGFRTVYEHAAPIMEKYGMKGNVFLPTKFIEEKHPHFMTWDMLRELCDGGAFSVAAHTHNHVDIRTLNGGAMREEIERSNLLIQQRLGIITESFCMPYGKYDRRSIRLLKRSFPYRYIFACHYGHASCKHMGRRLLPRIGISNDDSMEIFQKKMNGGLNWKGIFQKVRLIAENMKRERILQYDIE